MHQYLDFVQEAEELVKLSTELASNPDPEKKGGIITHWRFGGPMFSLSIGTVADESKLDKYKAFSQEKAFRVQADFLRRPETTVSSWQTRDPEIERYGGAVICNLDGDRSKAHDIISFSGLKEHVDEAVSLLLCRSYQLIDEDYVKRVIEASQNPVYNELLTSHNPTL